MFRLEMSYIHYVYDSSTDFFSKFTETTLERFQLQLQDHLTLKSDSRTFFELYEPKKIYLVPQEKHDTVLVTLPNIGNSSSTKYKLAQDNWMYYQEDMGYKYDYLIFLIFKYKLHFSPTERFFQLVTPDVQKQLFTVLQVASRGHLLETTGKLKDTDLWLPIEMWHMILKFFY